MPLTFDAKFMVFRLLSSVPHSVFDTLLYLRLRRLVPFAIAHALMDGASVLIGVLLPQLRHTYLTSKTGLPGRPGTAVLLRCLIVASELARTGAVQSSHGPKYGSVSALGIAMA
jgi:hypothetical protein